MLLNFNIDPAGLPSDVSLVLAQHPAVDQLRNSLARALNLDEAHQQIIRDEIVGVLAGLVDSYLPG